MPYLTEPPLYHTQVLRMWIELSIGRASTWRFSLEDVCTGKRRGFADLDDLVWYLLDLMEEPDGDVAPPG